MAKSKKRKRSKTSPKKQKPKFHYALFCLYHSTNTEGQQNYMGTINGMSIILGGHKTKPKELPQPVSTNPFVVAYRIDALGAETWSVRISDPNEKKIAQSPSADLASSADGKHSINLQLANGIPIQVFGDYSFTLYIDDKKVGVATLPIQCRIKK